MAINTDLLIAAPMLQNYLVDKDTGAPLTNGIVSLYKDTQRSFYKNWYYQTGIPGAYTWVALDNPLHLSSSGTITDPNGNDVIPFYYPFSEDNENQPEAYYITVYSIDENGDPSVLQFTRENFPYSPSNFSPTVSNPTFRNYILNNVYWRNCGSFDASNEIDKIIAPSQHEGYTHGDIRFLKNVTGATDTLNFVPMTETLDNDITPEYYINFTCTVVQPGETMKCVQYPISLHIDTLKNVDFSVVFHGQNVAGNTNNYVDLYIYQYCGTGALSNPDPVFIRRVTLNNEFNRYVIQGTFPDSEGLSLGIGGDDALYLRVQYPLSAICAINHTKPQVYLSTDVPDNDFDTYDQIETIINSPRTGDFRTSLNSFQPFGYVPANNGSIGSAASAATTRANNDTWPLYNLLWSSVNDTFAPVSTGRGGSAYSDFSANKTLTLTQALGLSVLGIPTSSTFTYDFNTGFLTIADASLYYMGSPVLLSNSGGALPGAFSANTIYYAIPVNSTTIELASTYANAIALIPVAPGADNGTGTQTISFALGGAFGQPYHVQTIAEMPSHNHTPLDPSFTFSTYKAASGTIETQGPGNDYSDDSTTANTGGGNSFNIVQPSVYMYVYFKL